MEALNDGRKCYLHHRTIVFIQTDVLGLIHAEGKTKPIVLIWEQEIVACNQVARTFGIYERMPLTQAMVCPGLIIIGCGDNLLEFKTILDKISKVLLNYASYLERIGLDQCFLDLSTHPSVKNLELYSDQRTSCVHGCTNSRLIAGLRIASDLQNVLQNEIRIGSRVGVSYSKTLARIAAERCSVGECGPLLPEESAEFLPAAPARLVFPDVNIPLLIQRGIRTVKDVRAVKFETLKDMVGSGCAVRVRNAVSGLDSSTVVPCDRWRRFSVECEVREKFRVLLLRLLSLTEDSGRTPLSLKVSVRQYDQAKNVSCKEAKTGQIPIAATPTMGKATPEILTKLLSVVMSLFHRIVDVSQSFHLTLLGLAFVRFEERNSVRSVASCLLRKRDLSVQTVVSMSCEGETSSYTPKNSRDATPEPPEHFDESGPSEKKAKLDVVIKKRKFQEDMELCSPSKLKVGDLNLNGDDVSTNSHNFIHC